MQIISSVLIVWFLTQIADLSLSKAIVSLRKKTLRRSKLKERPSC